LPVALDRRIDALLPGAAPAGARAAQARRAPLATPTPPPPAPNRPAQPTPPAVMHRPPRKPGERAAPPRETQREPQQAEAERHDGALRVAAAGEREQGRGGDCDDNDGADVAGAAAGDAATEDELDSQLLSALLAQSHESGMFEVLLPGGETLGVAVDVRPEAVDYLLTPPSAGLAAQLRGRQMELAGQLGQRIGRSVRITVL